MKDIHSHILYSIDDGAGTIEESLEIIKKAIKNGYTDIVLTPHYRKKQGFHANNIIKKNLFEELLQEAKKNKLKINLYLGNEITVDKDLFYYLKTNQLASLNRSRYLLLELPFTGKLDYLDEFIDDLMNDDFIIIIPHPERYHDYKINDLVKLHNKGVLFQGNIESLYDSYGEKCRKKLEKLLMMHLISFMGSDIHSEKSITYERDIIKKLMVILNDKKMVLDLVDNNIDKVIKDEIVKPYEIKLDKKKIGV